MVRLGNSGITSDKNGFGALPLQRIPKDDAIAILRRAAQAGITYYDTARIYSDSEEKIGEAFAHMREKVTIATKTSALDAVGFWIDLKVSLGMLNTDYIDIYQFHNPPYMPVPGDGLYDAALEAKSQGLIRHIGITTHHIQLAENIIRSGLYDMIQFPFSYISEPPEEKIVAMAEANGVGFIAMKALAGGLITNAAAAFAFMAQFPGVLPIWGIQNLKELEEFISYAECPPEVDLESVIAKDREQLGGSFCRGCGYCMPCSEGIKIYDCARTSLLLRRALPGRWLAKEWQHEMFKVENCKNCGQCVKKCPFDLDVPGLLRENLEDYRVWLEGG